MVDNDFRMWLSIFLGFKTFEGQNTLPFHQFRRFTKPIALKSEMHENLGNRELEESNFKENTHIPLKGLTGSLK